MITSNKAFSDWGQVFAEDPIMASAALDRLLHRFASLYLGSWLLTPERIRVLVREVARPVGEHSGA